MTESIWPIKPYRMIIAGPSFCGKTQFAVKTLKETYAKDKFNTVIIFAPEMSITQDAYKEIMDLYGEENVVLIQDLPSDLQSKEIFKLLESAKDAKESTLVIIDDLASKAATNKFIANITTAATHHLGVSMMFLQQTHFLPGSGRTARLNVDYLVCFPMHADKASFGRLAQQMEPLIWKDIVKKFNLITKVPFTPLIIDFKAQRLGMPEKYWFRDGWWNIGIEFERES